MTARLIPDALIGEASPRLLYLLETWRQEEGNYRCSRPDPTFASADGGYLVRAHFAPLGGASPAPVLVSWKTRACSPRRFSSPNSRPSAG